ncbi:MAG: hypothetical protein ABIG46_06425 [Candidatus Omnitrophota bacterium]|nr:hypothetical protein [Candidatus Omnitrophota bacterium]
MDWKENKVIGLIAGVILIFSIILVIILLQPKKIRMAFMAEGADEVFEMNVPIGTQGPVVNPKTGARVLYPATKLKCQKCGWEGWLINWRSSSKPLSPKELAKLSDEKKSAKIKSGLPTVCPRCGSPQLSQMK